MKITLIIVLSVLLLLVAGLGFWTYRLYQQTGSLETQVVLLNTEVEAQHTGLASQKKAIGTIYSNQRVMGRVLLRIVDFLNSSAPEAAKPDQNSYAVN